MKFVPSNNSNSNPGSLAQDRNNVEADLETEMENHQKKPKVWKLVLTGGPCGGKTTGQARLCTFFENLGWKVFRVPETASVLLAGGVNFAELTPEAAEKFQVKINLAFTVFNCLNLNTYFRKIF